MFRGYCESTDQRDPLPTADSSNPSGSLDLDDDDLALLVRFVNPSYLSEDSWPKIQAKFEEDGSVQLQVTVCS